MLAMARDGLLPISFFGAIHPVYGTPYKSTILTGVMVSLLSSLIPLSILVELVSIGTLLAFFIVCVSILVLRHTAPDLPRPFRCPLVPLIPALGAFLCLMLMLSLPGSNWYRLAGWLGLGMVVYWGWGRKNAKRVKMAKARDEDERLDGIEEGEEREGENETRDDQQVDSFTTETVDEQVEDEEAEDGMDVEHAGLNHMPASDD
jgi:amino acid transporter